MMTFSAAQEYGIRRLIGRYGAGEAASIIRILLEDAFLWKTAQKDRQLTDVEQQHFESVMHRLDSGEPLQYVLGEADFFGLKFRVTPAVLIPRQETEELVAWVLQYLKTCSLQQPSLLDIGFGSGCIGLTLKKKNPDLQLTGLDISAAALEVARENANRILGNDTKGLDIRQADILDPDAWSSLPDFDVIVSNPPYIPDHEKHLVPEHVQAHEPLIALFVADEDPLLFYRVIADFAKQKLRASGALFFECNQFNASEVAQLMREKGFLQVTLEKDLSGAARMVRAML